MSTPLSKSANQFAVDLFQCYLRRHGDKYRNLLLCPYLIYHSLAMMLVGARGNTEDQLMKLLRIPRSNHSCSHKSHSHSTSSSCSSSAGQRPTSKSAKGKDQSATPSGTKARSGKSKSASRGRGSSIASPQVIDTVNSSNICGQLMSPMAARSAAYLTEKSLGARQLTPDGANEARHREFLMLTEQLIHGNHDFVHLASFIYMDKSAKRTERFKAILRDYYETKPKKIDFDNADLMVKTVNEDVARTTENIYQDILSKAEAQKLEKSYMLLVNAVFFRGFWLSNFTDVKKAQFVKCPQRDDIASAKQATAEQAQQAASLQQSQLQPPPVQQQQAHHIVNMMSKLDYLPIVQDEQLEARVVRMPFEASDLQMLLILPNDRHSDSTYLCEKISAAKLNRLVEQFSRSKCKTVRISMPIFCIDSGKISIQSTLATMGASDLFSQDKADMGGVCETRPIWLHKILHRCFIICDNRGAITSLSSEKARRRQARLESGISSGRSGVDEFVADHPFMYIIMDSVTKTILLIGLYTDPSETMEVVHENELSPEEAHQLYTEGVYKT